MNFIIWCVIFALFSCLDVATTYRAMRNTPIAEMHKHEMNPIASKIIANKSLTWAAKVASIGFIIGLLAHSWLSDINRAIALNSITIVSILMILVVANNTYAIWAMSHNHATLGESVAKHLHCHKLVAYVIMVLGMLTLSLAVANILY